MLQNVIMKLDIVEHFVYAVTKRKDIYFHNEDFVHTLFLHSLKHPILAADVCVVLMHCELCKV